MRARRTIWASVLMIAIALQVLFITKRVQNYPFMIFDMYSRPVSTHSEQMHYRIIADADTINLIALPKFQEGRIINYLDRYRNYQATNSKDYWDAALTKRQQHWSWMSIQRSNRLLRNDAQAVDQLPDWLLLHAEKYILNRPIQKLRVEWVRFDHERKEEHVEQVLIES